MRMFEFLMRWTARAPNCPGLASDDAAMELPRPVGFAGRGTAQEREPLEPSPARSADDPATGQASTAGPTMGSTSMDSQPWDSLPEVSESSLLFSSSQSWATAEKFSVERTPTIGPYLLRQQIGQGSSGLVFRAEHRDLPGEWVAVKVFHRRGSSAIDRLEIEKLVLQKLQHPNLVRMITSGQTDQGVLYLVMEYVEGQRIDRYLRRQILDFKQTASLFAELADAMELAHQMDILHRDLKPSNILIGPNQRPVVVDFGLAKRMAPVDDRSLTVCGGLIGTLGYLAPEQASARRVEVTRKVDIYGLGATLYHVLTGQAPVERVNVIQSLEQLRTTTPQPPRKLNPLVPPDLESICLRCLARVPLDRYDSMRQLAVDLRRFAAGQRLASKGPGRLNSVYRWCQANPVIAALACSLMLTLSGGLGTSLTLWRKAVDREARATALVATAKEILQAGDKASESMLVQVSGSVKYRQQRLEQSVDFYEQLLGLSPEDDDLYYESAVSWFRLGKVRALLGRWPAARQAYQIANSRFRELAAKQPNNDQLQFDVFHSLLGLDAVDSQVIAAYRQHEWEALHLPEALEIIRQLVSDHPENIHYLDALACTLGLIGNRQLVHDLAGARHRYLSAYETARQLKTQLPNPCLQWRHVGVAATSLARVDMELGDWEAADAWLEIALRETSICCQRADADPGEMADWANCLRVGIDLETRRGDHLQAADYVQQWSDFVEKCARDYPEHMAFQELIASKPQVLINLRAGRHRDY